MDICFFSTKSNICKKCNIEYQKEYRLKNKDILSKKKKEEYILNKEKYNNYHKKYREDHRIEINIKRKLYRIENKDKVKESVKKSYYKNRDKILLSKTKYNNINRNIINDKMKQYSKNNRKIINKRKRERIKNDIRYRIELNLRTRLRRLVKNKNNTFNELLSCSGDQFIKYLESKFKPGMSWNNYGYRGWHIDHIIPCASFNLEDENQQKECFHYANLQPLWWIENIKKGKKINE